MDLFHAMRTVVAIVDTGSFTRAAERLSLSRAMATKHVADLEAHLSIRLFNRTTRRLSLTDDGAEVVETFRRVLELVAETEKTAQDRAISPTGLLRVSAPMSFGIAHVSPLITPYLRQHPGAKIDLSLNDRFVDLIEEGYDLAIRIGALADSSLIATRLAESQLYVVASPSYLAREGRPQSTDEFAHHSCLEYAHSGGRELWTFIAEGRTIRTPPHKTLLRCNNGDALMRMAIDGGGLALLPDFIVGEHVRAGRLELVLPKIATRTLGVYAVYPAGRHVPRKTRAFVDHLRASFTGKPPWALYLADTVVATMKPRRSRARSL